MMARQRKAADPPASEIMNIHDVTQYLHCSFCHHLSAYQK